MTDREFLFEYRFAGAEWGISIHAANPAEAKEKIKAVSMSRYKGEVQMTIPLSPRKWGWWRRRKLTLRDLPERI